MSHSSVTEDTINLTRQVQIDLEVEHCSNEVFSSLKIPIPPVLIGSASRPYSVSPSAYLPVKAGMKLDINADPNG